MATARLRELGGFEVYRPSGIFRTYSGEVLDLPPLGAPISFPTKVEDIYQHFHVLQEEYSDDNIRDSGLWTLFPVFGPLAAILSNLGGYAKSETAYFDFSQNKCPQDGVFLVTALVAGWGKYRLYSDDQAWNSREAGVRIDAYFAGLDPNYSGVKTVFADGDDNIDVYFKDFAFMEDLSGMRQMKAGEPLFCTPQVSLTCVTKGAAIAELDLSPGVGAVACMGLTIEKVG